MSRPTYVQISQAQRGLCRQPFLYPLGCDLEAQTEPDRTSEGHSAVCSFQILITHPWRGQWLQRRLTLPVCYLGFCLDTLRNGKILCSTWKLTLSSRYKFVMRTYISTPMVDVWNHGCTELRRVCFFQYISNYNACRLGTVWDWSQTSANSANGFFFLSTLSLASLWHFKSLSFLLLYFAELINYKSPSTVKPQQSIWQSKGYWVTSR